MKHLIRPILSIEINSYARSTLTCFFPLKLLSQVIVAQFLPQSFYTEGRTVRCWWQKNAGNKKPFVETKIKITSKSGESLWFNQSCGTFHEFWWKIYFVAGRANVGACLGIGFGVCLRIAYGVENFHFRKWTFEIILNEYLKTFMQLEWKVNLLKWKQFCLFFCWFHNSKFVIKAQIKVAHHEMLCTDINLFKVHFRCFS